MRVAPFADRVEVGGDEARAVEPSVGRPDLGLGAVLRAARVEPALHVGAEGAARRRLVVLLEAGPAAQARDGLAARERDAHRVAGLVREEAGHGAVGEPRREARGVDLVRELEEASRRAGLADVRPAARAGRALPGPPAAGRGEDAELRIAPGLVLRGDAAAARAARPVELVVEPDAEAAARGLVAEPRDGAQPVLAHVFDLETAARVDEKRARALRIDARDRRADGRLRRPPCDGDERHDAPVAGKGLRRSAFPRLAKARLFRDGRDFQNPRHNTRHPR